MSSVGELGERLGFSWPIIEPNLLTLLTLSFSDFMLRKSRAKTNSILGNQRNPSCNWRRRYHLDRC